MIRKLKLCLSHYIWIKWKFYMYRGRAAERDTKRFLLDGYQNSILCYPWLMVNKSLLSISKAWGEIAKCINFLFYFVSLYSRCLLNCRN